MKAQKTIDLTKGNVFRTLLLYCLPLLGSALIQQAYSLADLLIVGNFARDGQTALTSVGEASTMVNILMAFAFGSNGGCSVTVAKFFGAKDNLKVRETVNTALITFSVLCAAVMGVGFAVARASMRLLDVTNPVIMRDSLTYLYIYLGSLPFVFLYNIGCGICSALGDSKSPFLFLIFSSVLNVGLDLLFVSGFHWDVAGAAWATFISQACATVLTVIVLIKKLSSIKSEQKPAWFNRSICRDLTVTSIPIILQNSFVSFGNFFIVKRINLISEDAVAGFTTGFKLIQISIVGVSVMTNGLANFCSQNKAAGEYGRIRKGYLALLAYAMCVIAVFVILCECIPRPLTMVFIENPTEEAVRCSVKFLKIVAAFMPVAGVKIVSDGTVRGCGGNFSFAVATFTDLILRVAFVYLLVGSLGFAGVAWAWVIGWAVSTCMSVCFYLFIPCLRRRKSPDTQSGAL